ncbi:MAG: phage shock protein C [Desulfobacteraceae bacterium IS3]|nr:MAG: phage shock protein C [Desulfobacteraceae bacterium IS3]
MRQFEGLSGKGIYRSRDGVILGVCKGIAAYFDFSVFWVRTITVLIFCFSGFWPLTGVYILAALLMKPEPVLPIETEEEAEFYDSYVHSRKGAVHRLKRKYDSLDRRIQRMEDRVTSREFDWERRLNG